VIQTRRDQNQGKGRKEQASTNENKLGECAGVPRGQGKMARRKEQDLGKTRAGGGKSTRELNETRSNQGQGKKEAGKQSTNEYKVRESSCGWGRGRARLGGG
jgi:hypothetical protein